LPAIFIYFLKTIQVLDQMGSNLIPQNYSFLSIVLPKISVDKKFSYWSKRN